MSGSGIISMQAHKRGCTMDLQQIITQQAVAQFLMLFHVVWLTGIAPTCITGEEKSSSSTNSHTASTVLVLVLIFVSYCLIGRNRISMHHKRIHRQFTQQFVFVLLFHTF
jgi:hypothetical protein